jgi:hypothetical protein
MVAPRALLVALSRRSAVMGDAAKEHGPASNLFRTGKTSLPHHSSRVLPFSSAAR